eukprot:TRINITY_DN4901_c0_g1_i4.p1 TRINITY_DN4901_c0_g1~~TRINITY_DN4901_c0_g1_i4.p1  ORF type:complete len:205 (-),score=30.52 TRINITY_DN4901_c0_g1_i4:405-1019(-)
MLRSLVGSEMCIRDRSEYSRMGAVETGPARAPAKCQDGNNAIPRYHSTYEKPGYAGHVPMHIEDTLKNADQRPARAFLRNVPGYTGLIPGTRTRVGETHGKLASRKRVNTPQQISGSRLLFSAHGSFRPADPATPPWHTDALPTLCRADVTSNAIGSRPGTGMLPASVGRPISGTPPQSGSRPVTGQEWSSRPNTQSQIEFVNH